MALLVIRSAFLMLCLMLIAKCSNAEQSVNILRLLYSYNGQYSNRQAFLTNVFRNPGLVQLRLEPVLVPQLQPEPMIYMEEAVNGTVTRMAVGNLTERNDGNDIYVDLLNFTDISAYKPNTFNTDDLKHVKADEFISYGPCPQMFIPTYPGTFAGNWDDCQHTIDGKHPFYIMGVNCYTIETAVSVEQYDPEYGYNLVRHGPRYPMIDPPADFVFPCQ